MATAVKDLDKRPIHTPYITSFKQAKTKDGITITSAVLKRYYSVIDAEIYFQNEFVEDIADINWGISQNVVPLFGYNSYIYDEVARGSRLLHGTFSLNFISPNYLFDLLANIQGTSITNLSSYLTHPKSVKAGEIYGSIDSSLQGKREAPDHAPIWDKTFDIDVIFGQKTGVGDPVHILLEGVAIQSSTLIMSAYSAGTPPIVQEQYSFIARDVQTIG